MELGANRRVSQTEGHSMEIQCTNSITCRWRMGTANQNDQKITREQPCDDESLTTLMCHMEPIVNGRPITTVSDDPMDKEPLTPNHLLLMRSELYLPANMVTQRDVYRNR